MTPERWKKLEALFHEALELQGEARAAHLAKVCGSDEQLRAEVEPLLAAHERESSFLDSPILEQAAALTADDRHESPVGHCLGPYQVTSQLGRGGMGEVYLAEDPRLDRKVALKILPAAFTQHPERVRRFEREARAASALNHPNILTIYEIGQTEGLHFIATEFVEGVTLRQQMENGGRSLAETLSVAVQVASALSAAHAAGVVHRDIKPENVMLRPDGLVKVLDFGLAKLAEQRHGGDESALAASETAPGVVLGTVNYMSPEQARGLKVDHRTDIFSLGVVLYEMVIGRRPFEGETASDVIASILRQGPVPASRLRPGLPPGLERIISQMLTKDREARYGSAAELRAEFERLQRKVEDEAVGTGGAPVVMAASQAAEETKREGLADTTDREQRKRQLFTRQSWRAAAIGSVVLVLAAISYVKFFRGSPSAPPSEIKSLVVLPLENLSGDPEQEYFADGMTDALIGDLAKIGALRVISRTSAMHYKGTKKSLPEIARELQVDAVVEGTVQRAGDRVHIRVQLIQAATDRHLWVETYERDLRDVLALQSEVARAIAREIQIKITPDEQARLASTRPVNRKAYNDYLLGVYYWNRRTEEHLLKAIDYFESAIREDETYAPAYTLDASPNIRLIFLNLREDGEEPRGRPTIGQMFSDPDLETNTIIPSCAPYGSCLYSPGWEPDVPWQNYRRGDVINVLSGLINTHLSSPTSTNLAQ
jgi:TolB-like protein/predicted Ser/Thr protein kinase